MINSAQYLCLSLAFIGECVSLGSAISSTFVFEIPLTGFGQCLLGGGVGLAPAHIVNDPQGYSKNKFFTFISCESSRY